MTAKSDYQTKYKLNLSSQVAASSGVLELTGAVHDTLCPIIEAKTANYTLTPQDTGKIFRTALDGCVFTLPATAAGLMYTFINTGADTAAGISVSPAAADAIHGTTNAGTNVVLSGTDDKDVINTKGTSSTGDYITLIGDGDKGWFVVQCGGVWASE